MAVQDNSEGISAPHVETGERVNAEPSAANAATDIRAQRAQNDVEFVPTDADRMRVQIDIAAGASLPSIARRLRPPAGVSVKIVRRHFANEIKYGPDAIRSVALTEKLRLARGGHDAKAYDVGRATSDLLELIEPARKRTRKGERGQPGQHAEPMLEIPVTLNLGSNPPEESE